MLVCQSPEAEMNFCAAAFGAVEQVRRPGPDGSAIHIAMRINDAFLVARFEEEPHVNPNTQTLEFSLRDPAGYQRHDQRALCAPAKRTREADELRSERSRQANSHVHADQ